MRGIARVRGGEYAGAWRAGGTPCTGDGPQDPSLGGTFWEPLASECEAGSAEHRQENSDSGREDAHSAIKLHDGVEELLPVLSDDPVPDPTAPRPKSATRVALAGRFKRGRALRTGSRRSRRFDIPNSSLRQNPSDQECADQRRSKIPLDTQSCSLRSSCRCDYQSPA